MTLDYEAHLHAGEVSVAQRDTVMDKGFQKLEELERMRKTKGIATHVPHHSGIIGYRMSYQTGLGW